jgi:hypothetical protein
MISRFLSMRARFFSARAAIAKTLLRSLGDSSSRFSVIVLVFLIVRSPLKERANGVVATGSEATALSGSNHGKCVIQPGLLKDDQDKPFAACFHIVDVDRHASPPTYL